MHIGLIKKSLSTPKNIDITDIDTSATTVGEFIEECVRRNYDKRFGDLDECVKDALNGFCNTAYYIVNETRGIKYASLTDSLDIKEGDVLVFIKLKYVRGLIW